MKHSKKTKKKIRQAAILRWSNPTFREKMKMVNSSIEVKKRRQSATSGKNNPFYGKQHSIKTKKQISLNSGSRRKEVREKIRNSHLTSDKCRGMKHSKKTKMKLRKWNIDNPQKKFCNTGIEQKIAKELTLRKIKFKQNIGINNIKNVDFLLKNNIVIECNGCYYHNCPIHHPDKYIESRENDKKKTKLLQKVGYKVYRFWEHEINESPEKCINIIYEKK